MRAPLSRGLAQSSRSVPFSSGGVSTSVGCTATRASSTRARARATASTRSRSRAATASSISCIRARRLETAGSSFAIGGVAERRAEALLLAPERPHLAAEADDVAARVRPGPRPASGRGLPAADPLVAGERGARDAARRVALGGAVEEDEYGSGCREEQDREDDAPCDRGRERAEQEKAGEDERRRRRHDAEELRARRRVRRVVVDELQTAARAVVRVLRNDPGADGAGPRVPGHEMRLPAACAT